MEALELFLGSTLFAQQSPLNTSHHFSNDDQINDQRTGQQRVFADVEQRDGLVTTHEDLSVVFIQCALVITHSRHVLDHDSMIWVFTLLIQDGVGSDHVIHDIGFGDLLASELFLTAEILAVVVAQVVVACDAGEFDSGIDQEIYQGGLHLGLAGFEIITADECSFAFGELDRSWHECVLRGTIDECNLVESASNRKNGGWGDLLVSSFDGFEEVVSCVIDAWDDVGVTLGVGRPENNNLVQIVLSFEVAVLRSETRTRPIRGILTSCQL